MNPKGGCGKSTIAINLAGAFAARGDSVALMDCDPQASAAGWHRERPSNAAPITLLRCSLETSRIEKKVDFLVIDTPAGLKSKELRCFLRCADSVLLPILPSPMDVRAAEHLITRLIKLGKLSQRKVRLMTVANRVRENTKAAVKLAFYLEQLSLPKGKKLRCITLLRQSQNYIRSAEQGLSIFEFAPTATCYDREQWTPLLKHLRKI